MKNKILALVQLPPPVHGASLINKKVTSILESDSGVEVKVIRLNYATDFSSMHHSIWRKLGFSLKLIASFFGKLFFWRPDYIYISFAPYGLGLIRDFFIVKVALSFNCQVKAHLHGTGVSDNPSSLQRLLLKKIIKSSELIVISESLSTDVKRLGVPKKLTVINNCVATPTVKPVKDEKVFKVLFLANLDKRKGVLKALEVFEQYALSSAEQPSTMTIAGADTSLMNKESLIKYIALKHPSIKNKVEVIGPVYGADKSTLFCEHHLFLYPTKHDAAPLVVLEALSFGLPVISSTQGALTDMISDGENGYCINTTNTIDYVNAIQNVFNELSRFSNTAYQSHIKSYTESTFREKILSLFK